MRLLSLVLVWAADLLGAKRHQFLSEVAHLGATIEALLSPPQKAVLHSGLFENEKRFSSLTADGLPSPDVQILGMFDSGTNLLQSYLQGAFPTVNVATHCHLGGVWKHSPPQILEQHNMTAYITQKNGLATGKTKVLAMVRSPFAQLASWRETPYDLKYCTERSDLEWLVGVCLFSRGLDMDLEGADMDKHCDQRLSNVTNSQRSCEELCTAIYPEYAFASTVDVWNQYVQGYTRLAHERDVMLIKYEDLVLFPRKVLREQIAPFLGQTPPNDADVHVFLPPQKDHGHLTTRGQAIEALQKRSYMSKFQANEKVAVCSRLAPSVLEKLGYDDCKRDGYEVGNMVGAMDCDNSQSTDFGGSILVTPEPFCAGEPLPMIQSGPTMQDEINDADAAFKHDASELDRLSRGQEAAAE